MYLEEERIDMSTIVIRATWDPEASYWVAESPDVPGLATGATTLNELAAKLPGIVQDLLKILRDAGMRICATCF
jgi:predicted RNase H-like HicB family nuclease